VVFKWKPVVINPKSRPKKGSFYQVLREEKGKFADPRKAFFSWDLKSWKPH
jgi:hypothetical protein